MGASGETTMKRNSLAIHLLREVIQRIRNDSGSLDDMEPFAYDADWESWARDVDDLLAGREFKPRERYVQVAMPQHLYRIACVFDPDGRRMCGKRADGSARTLKGIWRAFHVLDVDAEDAPFMPPVRMQRCDDGSPGALFVTSLRPYRRHSIINPARTVLQYLRLFKATLQ
jgi:hypothetical protein